MQPTQSTNLPLSRKAARNLAWLIAGATLALAGVALQAKTPTAVPAATRAKGPGVPDHPMNPVRPEDMWRLNQGMAQAYVKADGSTGTCLSHAELAKYAGFWLPEPVAKAMPATRNWFKLDWSASGTGPSMIQVFAGRGIYVYGWHEGAEGACTTAANGKLYSQNSDWGEAGPYVKVMDNTDGRKVFDDWAADQLFGARQCYRSEQQETWCFNQGLLTIDGIPYHAQPLLDGSELPHYGNVMSNSITKTSQYLVYAPTTNGFEVYEDQDVSGEDYKPAGPGITKPWRKLTRIVP